MKTRAQQLRTRGRKIFAWSLAIAAAIHLAVFLLTPGFRTELITSSEIRLERPGGPADGAPILLSLFFGPPTITAPDGTPHTEPPERFLEAERLVLFPEDCPPLLLAGNAALLGRVRLLVNPSGRTRVVDVATSTGNPCGDEVMTIVADALWYHWLPSDDYPAPVQLTQPITITEVEP